MSKHIDDLRPRLSLRERMEQEGIRRSNRTLLQRAVLARQMSETLLETVSNIEIKTSLDGVEVQTMFVAILDDIAWLLGEEENA